MGCGIKAYYEDLEEEYYNHRVAKIKEKTPDEILSFYDKVNKDFTWLSTQQLHLTKAEWATIERIKQALMEFMPNQ